MQNSKSDGNGMSWLYHLIWIIPVIGVILFHYEGGVGWFGSVFFTLALVGTLFRFLAEGGVPDMGGSSAPKPYNPLKPQYTPPQYTQAQLNGAQQLNGGKKYGKKRK
jgi:hypothetical protein